MNINQYLVDYYNNYDEDGRLTSRHGSVEFLTTMRYIEKYIKKGDRVLDIGAGTGRYSHALARQGYTVDAVELVGHNIEIFRNNILPEEKITVIQGNALDLSVFPDNNYDITLLFGPMYHLYSVKDKQTVLKEAIRVTKSGGVIFVAYIISDATVIDEGFNRNKINIAEYIDNGLIDCETFATRSEPQEIFELVRKEDIDKLMSEFSVSRLHYVATDGCTRLIREAINAMDEEKFNLYLKYHFATCERKDFIGITNHSLDIFRKNR